MFRGLVVARLVPFFPGPRAMGLAWQIRFVCKLGSDSGTTSIARVCVQSDRVEDCRRNAGWQCRLRRRRGVRGSFRLNSINDASGLRQSSLAPCMETAAEGRSNRL